MLTQKLIHPVAHPVAVNVDDRNHAVFPILSGKLVHLFRISIADSIVQYRKQTFIMDNIFISVPLLELNPGYIFRFRFIMDLSGDRLVASILLFHNRKRRVYQLTDHMLLLFIHFLIQPSSVCCKIRQIRLDVCGR